MFGAHGVKTCKGCGKTKPLDHFHKCKTVKDGRKSRCADCMNSATRKWRAENPEKAELSVSNWRKANMERYLEKKRAADAAYKAANADLLKDKREAKREYHAVRLAEWKQANRERVRDYERKRRAAVRGADIADMDLDQVWVKSAGICGLCSGPLDRSLKWPHRFSVSLDHIIPLSRGGAHSTDNARYVHLSCNASKNNRLDSELTSAVLPRSGTRP